MKVCRSEPSGPLRPTGGPSPVLGGLAELERAKERVGEVKLRAGDAAWRTAINYVDPCARLPQQRRVPSRAYFKWVELASAAGLRRGMHVLHLCEAPGGFAQATHDMGAGFTAHSLATSDAIRFRRLPRSGRVLTNCPDDGDLLKPGAFQHLLSLGRRFDVVTADGSVDFESEHAQAEACNFALVLREALVARYTLKPGGALVLKLLGADTEATWGLVQLLTDWFEGVWFDKPASSRPTNSEQYVVCLCLRADAPEPPPELLSDFPMQRLYERLDPELARCMDDPTARRKQLQALHDACDLCEGKRMPSTRDDCDVWWCQHGPKVGAGPTRF